MEDVRIYNPTSGAWEFLKGSGGAAKVQLSDAEGVGVGTADNPVSVLVGGTAVNLTAPSPDTITNTPVTGLKTVVATAAEVFAGSSVLTSRKQLSVRNDDPVNRIRVGPSGVTQQSGYPIEPGASAEFRFDAATAKAIYAISEGAAVQVEVWEA